MRPVLATLIVCALLGCGSESTTPAAVTDASGLPADQVIYGVRHNMTHDGIRSGELASDSAYLFEAGRKLDLMSVRLRFFGEAGQESGTLTSETGEYNIRTGKFIARGDVVLITEGPRGTRRLETEELHYDVPGDRLWTDEPFVLREGRQVTHGQSFRSDSKFQTWTVTGAKTSGGLPEAGSEGRE